MYATYRNRLSPYHGARIQEVVHDGLHFGLEELRHPREDEDVLGLEYGPTLLPVHRRHPQPRQLRQHRHLKRHQTKLGVSMMMPSTAEPTKKGQYSGAILQTNQRKRSRYNVILKRYKRKKSQHNAILKRYERKTCQYNAILKPYE